jgi:FMN phosphatase YigB (HAD superfamily)
MNIFIDLDGTLFDTPQLGADTAALLQQELGVNPDDYEATRQEMFAMNNKIYSAELHARRLAKRARLDESALVQRFIDLFNNEDSKKYVYYDSVEFLKNASKLGPVAILTYGEAFVQTPRATKSGLRSLVSDVIVTQHNKADTLIEYFKPDTTDGKKMVLIDDSAEHLDDIAERFPDSLTVHLVRNPAAQASPKHRKASSLAEALKLIK